MKVLITTDTYFPMINGVVTSTNNLYKELKRKGHDVRILTLSHTGEEKVIGDVYYLKSMGVKIYPSARIKVPFYNKLIKKILDWKPEIIHSQTEFSTMLAAKHISSRLNIPLVHTYHTMYEDYLEYILGGRIISKNTAAKLTRTLLNTVNEVIVPTEKTRQALINYGVNNEINIIPTGIDLSRFQKDISTAEKEEIFNKSHLKASDRIIAYVGRIAKEKNITEIIALFPAVIEKIHNTKLLIVGSGPYLDTLKEQVKLLNLESSVIFTGMIAPEEVYKYYKIAEIFVTASTSETQGLTYIEALSSGCPVVCKWDSCINEIISQGKNGFAYKQPYEFSHYIVELLQDFNMKATMKNQAIIKANQYSSSVFANKVLDSYVSVININMQYVAV